MGFYSYHEPYQPLAAQAMAVPQGFLAPVPGSFDKFDVGLIFLDRPVAKVQPVKLAAHKQKVSLSGSWPPCVSLCTAFLPFHIPVPPIV
jgi:hypothetical protein